jgi:hypothetical protein
MQKPIMTYACLDTELEDGYPPIQYAGVTVRNDSICEVMNTATNEIFKIFKMNNSSWHEYIVGESAYPETLYQEWTGYPDTPTACPTATYPHQIIVTRDDVVRLYCSTQQIVYNWGEPGYLDTYPAADETVRGFFLDDGEWNTGMDTDLNLAYPTYPVLKSNRDIINLQTGAVVYSKVV